MDNPEKKSLKLMLREEREGDIFRTYTNNLKLTPEELSKSILDVGGETGEFANEAKRRGYENITSSDKSHPDEDFTVDTDEELAAGKLVVADAAQLPFQNNQFDLVVSINAIPNVLVEKKMNANAYRKIVARTLTEMLRVAKDEVRLGRVNAEHYQDEQFSRGKQIERVLSDLAEAGYNVSKEPYSFPDSGNPDLWLVRIRKNS